MKNILWCQISDDMIKKLLLILIIFALGPSAKAQSFLPTLKVTNIIANGIANFPDTIYQGIAYNFSITVTNLDSNLVYINDSNKVFAINMQTDSIGFPPFVIFSDSSLFTIAGYDSITFNVIDSFTTTGLKLGNNVVVVWPSVTGAGSGITFVPDTIKIYFVGTSGIPYFDKNDLLFYPNPFNDFINIKNTFDNAVQLFIYDEIGKLVYENPFSKKSYDLSFLKQGLYFAELRKTNIVMARRKMIKL